MSKDRDYSGLECTPSSMAWLIGQRSIIKGQIDRLTQMQARIPERPQTLKQDLKAIDAVIPLHDLTTAVRTGFGEGFGRCAATSSPAVAQQIAPHVRTLCCLPGRGCAAREGMWQGERKSQDREA